MLIMSTRGVPSCLRSLDALDAVKHGCPAHTALATNADTPMAETGTAHTT